MYLSDVDPEDETDWPRQHEWLAGRLNEMHRVFAPRVRALDADARPADHADDMFSVNDQLNDRGG
jgi:hypothetical protein